MIQVRRSEITCLNVVKKDLMTYQKKKENGYDEQRANEEQRFIQLTLVRS